MSWITDAHTEWHWVNGKTNAACPLDCMAGVDDYHDEDEEGCEGHESLNGPIGNVEFCDGTCKP